MTKASGKFVLRTGSALHQQLKDKARQSGMSLNELCLSLIRSSGSSIAPMDDLYKDVIKKAEQSFGNDFAGLVLFGSHARGDTHDLSDIDLLIVLNASVAIRRQLYRDWQDLSDSHVTVHFASLPDPSSPAGSLWLECALDGIVMHDPSGCIRRNLQNLKSTIASGKVVRRVTHGQGYWVHL